MKRLFPFIGFFLLWVAVSSPFLFKGLIPAPFDLLVNFFAPWDKYYDTPIKNPAIADVVNQIIPWKTFTAWSLKLGQFPLWNPYNLAGAPHLGNWQSGVLYPTNILFLFLKFPTAWSFHILLQPLLAGMFTLAYLRSLGCSREASLLGGISFAYSGFLTTWLEWGTLGHAILWLPLVFLASDKIRAARDNRKNVWIAVISFALAFSLLAGHIQISLYVFVASVAYWLYRGWKRFQSKRRLFLATGLLFLVPFLLAAPQIFPSIQLYFQSYRAASIDQGWFMAFRIPVYGLLTFIAPDFFGNPVTRNHWSDHSYVEMMGYVGMAPLILSVATLFRRQDRDLRRFFWILAAISLLISLSTPLANLLFWLRLPILASSSPARVIGLVSFALSVLAAYGWDDLRASFRSPNTTLKSKPLTGAAAIVLVTLAGMWIWTFTSNHPQVLIARRNLILPSGIAALAMGGIFAASYSSQKTPRYPSFLLSAFFLLLTAFDLFRFHRKFTPFTPLEYFYPTIPVIEFLQSEGGRTFGLFDANLNLPFRIATIEGYDPLVIDEYVRYTSTAETGEEQRPARSSGIQLPKNGTQTIKIISDLGVQYVIQPTIHGAAPWELRLWEFPGQFVQVYGDSEYEVFENLLAKEAREPFVRLKQEQKRWFTLGIVTSAGTIFLLSVGLILKTNS